MARFRNWRYMSVRTKRLILLPVISFAGLALIRTYTPIIILGLIVYDEFKMANEHGGELDENIIGLLQMSMTGVIGVVGGYIGGKSNG